MKKFIYIVIALGLMACNRNETDDLFGKTPTERMQENANELKTELVSSPYGWKFIYQTDDKKFGGFTFVMKFDDQGRVTMVSDFDQSTTTEQTSQYELKIGQGTLLSFVTKNHIHNLADAILGERGVGYKGEYEFVYVGKENGKIKFKTQRTPTKEVYFEKATQEDWDAIDQLVTNMQSLEGSESYWRQLQVTSPSGTEVYSLSLNLRYATVSNTTDSWKFGLIPTTNGFLASPPLEIQGKKFTEFVQDAQQPTKYVSKVDDAVAQISESDEPPYPIDDYKDIEKISNLIFITDPLKNTPLMSKATKELIKVDDTTDFSRVTFQFINNTRFAILVSYPFPSRAEWIAYIFNYELKDNKFFITGYSGAQTSNDAVWVAAENKAILDKAQGTLRTFYQLGLNGYNVHKRSEKYRYTNDIYVLQSGLYYLPFYTQYR